LAKGESDFYGSVRVIDEKGNDCIARYFRVGNNDVIQKGDVLVIFDKDQTVVRSKSSYSTKVIGVCIDTASLELGEKRIGNEFVLVALYGLAKINVDAGEGGPIAVGDLLVSALNTGHAAKADSTKIKPGTLIGKSLGECKKDKATINVLLSLG
jgi:hypothetical protein